MSIFKEFPTPNIRLKDTVFFVDKDAHNKWAIYKCPYYTSNWALDSFKQMNIPSKAQAESFFEIIQDAFSLGKIEKAEEIRRAIGAH